MSTCETCVWWGAKPSRMSEQSAKMLAADGPIRWCGVPRNEPGWVACRRGGTCARHEGKA